MLCHACLPDVSKYYRQKIVCILIYCLHYFRAHTCERMSSAFHFSFLEKGIGLNIVFFFWHYRPYWSLVWISSTAHSSLFPTKRMPALLKYCSSVPFHLLLERPFALFPNRKAFLTRCFSPVRDYTILSFVLCGYK